MRTETISTAFGATLNGGEVLFVPAGCAHGVLVIEPGTVLCWSSDAPFNATAASGVLWNDPALALDWPIDLSDAHLSERDAALPTLADQAYRFD